MPSLPKVQNKQIPDLCVESSFPLPSVCRQVLLGKDQVWISPSSGEHYDLFSVLCESRGFRLFQWEMQCVGRGFLLKEKEKRAEPKTLAVVTVEEGSRTAAQIMRLDRGERSEEMELKCDL